MVTRRDKSTHFFLSGSNHREQSVGGWSKGWYLNDGRSQGAPVEQTGEGSQRPTPECDRALLQVYFLKFSQNVGISI